jgi:hypothetical protein
MKAVDKRDGESVVIEKIVKMEEPGCSMAKRQHMLIEFSVPKMWEC